MKSSVQPRRGKGLALAMPLLLLRVGGAAVMMVMMFMMVMALAVPAVGAEPTLAEEAAFRMAVARVAGAVVRIEPAVGTRATLSAAAEAGGASGPSTGLVIDPAGLILATTFAVPEDATEAIVVLADGERRAAKPRGRDLARGIVLLETTPLPTAPAVEAVPRRDLAPGPWTIAVGRAWTAAEPSVAVGILSAVDRGWGLAVQTDASVSPMNYGGPLVDIAGRVIGVLAPLPADTAGMKLGTELYDAGIGFAVPLEDLRRDLPRLARGESLGRGILGISYRSRDEINGDPVLASVRHGSPAARAGLRAGDRIVEIDGRPVARIADVRQWLVPRHSGDEVELVIERQAAAGESARLTVKATLAATLPPWRRAVLGMTAVPEDDESAPLQVAWVLPGGPADRAGLSAGVTLMSIAAATDEALPPLVKPSAPALAGFLAGMEPGQRVLVTMEADGTPTQAELELAALPGEVPDTGPRGGPTMADPLTGPAEAVRVVRLEAAEMADPPLAVIPRGGRDAVAVLVYLGLPHGPVADGEAATWKAAVAESGVAVILPGSSDNRQWSRDDIPAVVRSLQSLHAKRPIDPARVAVAGSGAGGAFAWLVAERLGAVCRGIAVVDATMPRSFTIEPSQPGDSQWILLGAGSEPLQRRLEDDRRRLERAGYPVGSLAINADGAAPATVLCRWASLLGLL